MKRNRLKQFALILLTLFLCTWIFPTTSNAASISKKKLNMAVGDTFQLKVKGTTKKVKWRSSKSSVVSVTSNGTLKAKKYGKAVITAKVGKQSYKCNAFVSKNIATISVNKFNIWQNTISFKIKNNSCSTLTFSNLLGTKDDDYKWLTPLALTNPSRYDSMRFMSSFNIAAGKTRIIYFSENPTFRNGGDELYYTQQLVLPFKCQDRNYTLIAEYNYSNITGYDLKVKRMRVKIPTDMTIPLPEPEYATMDKYNRIATGMNYNQVRDIMGFEGELLNSSNNAYASYQYYKWYGKEDYTAVYVYFRNGTVFTTSQYGL